jgi:hypothetical protein
MPLPGMPRPLFRPRNMMTRIGIPPRRPVIRPMPPFNMKMSQGRQYINTMPRTLNYMPPGPQPRPQINLRPRPPMPFGFGPRPFSGFNSFFSQGRRFFGGNLGENFARMGQFPRPNPYQRFVYPQTQRRFGQFYENYGPEEEFNRSSFFTENNQSEQGGSEFGFDDDEASYLTYNMGRPRRIITTRSVSRGRNGGYELNFGQTKPRRIFKRVENRRLVRTARNQRNNPNNL